MSQVIDDTTVFYSALGTDADLGEIVQMFVSEMPERIDTLNSHFEQANWEGVRQVAHQLKGAAGSYGFGQITPYAAKLEADATGAAEPEILRQSLDALVDACGRLRAGAPQS